MVNGPIVFQNVGFQHRPDADNNELAGVSGVNLVIEPGEIVGIAGPSGAGKTTLADLLVGLFPPQQGRITVGGRPLEGAVLAAWRAQLSYISQDAFLFHDAVRRNLDWATPSATESDMWWALELAGADALVRRMPAGLNTVLGERGTLISGGERQRLALARAVLRKPRLVILDEATSAIDVAGERTIFDRLRAISPRPTLVIVAHRAESLACCDRTVRIEAGRIVGNEGERLKLAGGHA
jgi:ATP-binding cassette subfamily C protein